MVVFCYLGAEFFVRARAHPSHVSNLNVEGGRVNLFVFGLAFSTMWILIRCVPVILGAPRDGGGEGGKSGGEGLRLTDFRALQLRLPYGRARGRMDWVSYHTSALFLGPRCCTHGRTSPSAGQLHPSGPLTPSATQLAMGIFVFTHPYYCLPEFRTLSTTPDVQPPDEEKASRRWWRRERSGKD